MKPPLQRRGQKQSNGPVGGNVVQGLLLIARGRAEGVEAFAGTPDGFLSALSPWLAFLLVGVLLMVLREPSAIGGTLFLLSFCALLLPPVLSHLFAARWERGPLWLRYATAAVWCEWLVIFAYVASLVVVMVLLQLGVPPNLASAVLMGVVVCYWLWLHWFLAWRGLALTGVRAAVLVGSIIAATAVLCGVAQVLPPHVGMFAVPHDSAATTE